MCVYVMETEVSAVMQGCGDKTCSSSTCASKQSQHQRRFSVRASQMCTHTCRWLHANTHDSSDVTNGTQLFNIKFYCFLCDKQIRSVFYHF